MPEEKKGSIVDAKDYTEKAETTPTQSEEIPQPEDPNTPLFDKLDKIIEEMQNNTKALNAVAHQLCRVADGKGLPTGTQTPLVPHEMPVETPAKVPETNKGLPKELTQRPPMEVGKVMELFTPNLRSLLTFTKREKDIKVKATKYLGSETFAKIAGIIRDNKGEYISAGKESHFIVPFVEAKQAQAPAPAGKVVLPNEVEKTFKSTPAPATNELTVETLRELFTKDLEDLLFFEDKGTWIRVAPRQYLGSENFAKIASVVRDQNGEYVSAGKESHFRVNKKAT